MEKSCSTVCVTGASGFIGSMLVKRLLERGHIVHATLRDLGDDTKTGLLKKLPGADTRLEFYEADIYDSSSFESAIQGCEYVFLIATPMQHKANSTQLKDTSEAAVDAIQTILHLCEKSGTVKRIIYTGSVTAASPLKEDGTGYAGCLDESCWTPLNLSFPYPSNFEAAYTSSKTLSEKALLDYNHCEKNSLFEVVSLSIGLVGGETILSYLPGSVGVIVSSITGEMIFYSQLKFLQELLGSVPLVHIADLCDALIFCIEKPSMAGRFVCAAAYPSIKDFVEFYRDVYPDIAKIKEVEGDFPRVEGGSRKLVDVGFKYKYGAEETFEGSYKCAKKLGLLN
ncbi:anthocyanidin reductase-like protein [Carex littledalei]|uniref:Anthocyanidin reductase-like protein n=1 Tax=Carex littledalei TaxID=544730 RepID=A0A833VJ69_9POAL|nr:anthocyanidin reductase-like protein [Carex littledalei]